MFSNMVKFHTYPLENSKMISIWKKIQNLEINTGIKTRHTDLGGLDIASTRIHGGKS